MHVLYINAWRLGRSVRSYLLFVVSWTVVPQAPLSLAFLRQEYWSRLPFASLGDLPDQGLNPCLLHLLHWQVDSLPLSYLGNPLYIHSVSSVQFIQLCPTLCNPMDCSMPGVSVHHQLPELTQTHVNQVSDAIQPSHPLSSPSTPAFNLSQYQDLFQWVSSSHQVAKLLEL